MVRIAFSGSHRVGKTTLLERVADALPAYTTIDEPYHLLEADGHEFAQPPSLEDFEAQIERSLATIDESERDTLFDRCPVDLLAYLLVHDDAARFDPDDWLDRIRAAAQRLDLIVFVPIEDADRIAISSRDDAELRTAVDDKLHELWLDGAAGVDVEVLRVSGDLRARLDQVLARVRRQR